MAKELIKRNRTPVSEETFIEVVAWKVPKDQDYPEGVKYSFNLIEKDKRLIAFDNYNREGHHKHIKGKKQSHEFKSITETYQEFRKKVMEYLQNDKSQQDKD